MARIRTIKPEFWTDGAIVKLSAHARLMFLGALNFTMCDYGHLPDDPMRLKLQVLPMDDVDPGALIEELLASGRWVRLQGSEGRSYLHIKRFTDHQKVDRRWSPRCVACNDPAIGTKSEDSPNHNETPRDSTDHTKTPPSSPQERKGQERTGKEEKTSSSLTARETFENFWRMYPRKDGEANAVKAFDRAAKKHGASLLVSEAERWAGLWHGEGRDKKYIPHAATWLNGERWNDEPPTRRLKAVSGDYQPYRNPTDTSIYEGEL
jgi:hypothetical protein